MSGQNGERANGYKPVQSVVRAELRCGRGRTHPKLLQLCDLGIRSGAREVTCVSVHSCVGPLPGAGESQRVIVTADSALWV